MIIPNPDNKTYDETYTPNDVPCKVVFGGAGVTDKFVPNINCSKWNDEAWLNINHPDVVTTEKETFTDDTIELIIGNNKHRYYTKDGKLEYEIILINKPATNIITLDLDFPAGIDFRYQPPLTQKEIDDGHKRPENVVGSYAVYYSKRNNQYKTGKFCHIYRPKLIDNNNDEIWADLSITGKKLRIIIDKTWLENAIYPVIIDPNLGYDVQGASNWGLSGYHIACHDTTDASGGITAQLHIYALNASGSNPYGLKGAIYTDDTGNNRPEDQVSAETEVSIPALGDGKYDWTYIASLSASTKYWLAFVLENNNLSVYYDGGAPANIQCYLSGQPYDLPATWPDSGTNGTNQFSIWADYQATTTSTTPVPTSTSSTTPVPTSTSSTTPVPTSTSSTTPVPTTTSSTTPVPTSTSSTTPVPTSTSSTTPVPTTTGTTTTYTTTTEAPESKHQIFGKSIISFEITNKSVITENILAKSIIDG